MSTFTTRQWGENGHYCMVVPLLDKALPQIFSQTYASDALHL